MIELVEGGPTTTTARLSCTFQSLLSILPLVHVSCCKEIHKCSFFAEGPDQNAQQAQESPFLHWAHLESWILKLDLVIDGFCLNRVDWNRCTVHHSYECNFVTCIWHKCDITLVNCFLGILRRFFWHKRDGKISQSVIGLRPNPTSVDQTQFHLWSRPWPVCTVVHCMYSTVLCVCVVPCIKVCGT